MAYIRRNPAQELQLAALEKIKYCKDSEYA